MNEILSNYFSVVELATQLGKKPRTLKGWRDRRIGPPVTYLGGQPFYRKEAVKSWMLSLEGKPLRHRRRGAA